MKTFQKYLLFVVLGLLAVAGYYFIQNLIPFDRQRPTIGESAPEFSLVDLGGGRVRLSDFRGKVVLLNFGASWCPPCKEEMPGFQNVFLKYRNKGFAVITVALDDSNPSSMVKELGIRFPVVMPDEKISGDYGNIVHIPVSFLIGKDGKIIKKVLGLYAEKDLRSDVELALK